MVFRNLSSRFISVCILFVLTIIFIEAGFAGAPIKVISGTSIDVFNIGDSLATVKSKIPRSSFANYKFSSSQYERWNYKLTDKMNENKALSFVIENGKVKAILFHYGKSTCNSSIYMPFSVNGKSVIMNMSTENQMKKLFPSNEPYTYQVIGLLNIKEGLDFHFYPDECSGKNSEDVVKSIIIFEKGNSFLFDNDSGL